MSQPVPSSEDQYQRFIAEIRQSGQVWGLCCGEDWAYCDSHEFEETDVLNFWSTRADAELHSKGDWSEHQPTAIPVEEFIGKWLYGMDADGALVGPNWDDALNGLEVEPSEVAEALSAE